MRKIKIAIVSCLSVGLAGAAFAGAGSGSGSAAAGAGSASGSAAKAPAGGGSGSAAAAKPAGMEMPKPPQALLDMAKNMGGTWKCTGKVHMGPDQAMDVTANITGKLELDKMWWHETLTQTKAKTPYKFDAYLTVDEKTNKWMRVAVDNMGVMESTTSDDGNTWTGTSAGMGMSSKVKTVVTKGDKTIKLEGTMSMDGKTWMPSFEMDCKK